MKASSHSNARSAHSRSSSSRAASTRSSSTRTQTSKQATPSRGKSSTPAKRTNFIRGASNATDAPRLQRPRPVKTANVDERKTIRSLALGAQTEHNAVRQVPVGAGDAGQRLDNFLRKFLPGVPKSRVYQMIRKGEVRINKGRCQADNKLQFGDVVRIPPVRITRGTTHNIPDALCEQIKARILYQDDDYLVIDKPAGMAVHSGTQNDFGVIDVVNALFVPDDDNVNRTPWLLCHRLDKDTSGCLLMAASRQAQHYFQAALDNGQVYKAYLTLTKGRWQADELEINTPVDSRANEERDDRRVSEPKEAISIFSTEQSFNKTTLLRVVIKTGRTHQIRLHAAQADHPVAMDDKHGNFKWNKSLMKRGLTRLFLHAHVLRFQGPNEMIHVSAPLADDLQQFLELACYEHLRE